MSVIEPSSGDNAIEPPRGNGPLRKRDQANTAVLFDVSGIPVTPERIRKTRRWMLLLLLTPIVLFGISVLAFGTNGPPEPVVHPRVQPHGYQAITDAYFGYAAPNSYTQNTTWTSQNGNYFYGKPKAYVAQTYIVTKRAPSVSSRPPAAFKSYGQPKPAPYSTGPVRAVTVPGTHVAFEEQVTRPNGWTATAIDTWERDTSTQCWLLIHAPPTVTNTVIRSFQG